MIMFGMISPESDEDESDENVQLTVAQVANDASLCMAKEL